MRAGIKESIDAAILMIAFIYNGHHNPCLPIYRTDVSSSLISQLRHY